LGRIPRLTKRYLKARTRLGVRAGTALGRDVAREVGVLERANALPLPGDVYTLLPEDHGPNALTSVQVLAHVHRVPNRSLWLWYWWTDTELTLVGLTNVPPS
jgi:hypothetical protein